MSLRSPPDANDMVFEDTSIGYMLQKWVPLGSKYTVKGFEAEKTKKVAFIDNKWRRLVNYRRKNAL